MDESDQVLADKQPSGEVSLPEVQMMSRVIAQQTGTTDPSLIEDLALG